MRSSVSAALLALAASVSALQITFPSLNDTNGTPSLDLSVPQTITWTIDPKNPQEPTTLTKIQLVVPPVNNDTNTANGQPKPASVAFTASNIAASDLKYVLQPPTGLTVNQTYQIWFYALYIPNNSSSEGVIAESGFFEAGKIGGATPTTGGGSGGSNPTGSTSTVTPSSTKKPNGAGALKAFAGAGLLTACAMLFL